MMVIDQLEARRLFAAGDPLESYAENGVATFNRSFGNVIPAQVLSLQSGKTLIAVAGQYNPRNRNGQNPDAAPPTPVDFVRLNADGSPDSTFGSQAGVDSPFQSILRVTELPDGAFWAVGNDPYNVEDVQLTFLARFNANGTLDSSFGIGGRVELDLPTVANASVPVVRIAQSGVVTLQYGNTLTRFQLDGSRDPNFGVDGQITLSNFQTQRYFSVADFALADDGGVLLAGQRQYVRNDMQSRGINVIRKLSSDGTIDTSFGNNGEIGLGGAVATKLARVGSDWLLMSAFSTGSPRDNPQTLFLKFDDAGTPIPTFGDGGFVGGASYSNSTSRAPNQLVVQPDGRFITFGAYGGPGGYGSGVVLRYNADGSQDLSFGELRLPTGSTTLLTATNDGQKLLVANESRITALATGGNAVGPAYVNGNGTLVLRGSSRSEHLRIVDSADSFAGQYPKRSYLATRDIWSRVVPGRDVKRLRIDAGDGDDILTLDATNNPSVLNGGDGNDMINAAVAVLRDFRLQRNVNDVAITGGAGDDTITFYGNAVSVNGGAGDDHIIGNALYGPPNTLHGGDGDDVILSTGPTRRFAFYLFGDGGDDTLTSGNSYDRFYGGPGRDVFKGQRATDRYIDEDV